MKELFERELASRHMADAYLLVGAGRPRLRELALECSGILLGAKGDVEQHADFTLFDPEELGCTGLKVEHIASRKEGVPCLEQTLRYRPAQGRHRAVVLLDADRMTTDAHSALLKTTEEPPEDTVLFFTATELFALSPALRSRCRIWRVQSKPEAECERLGAGAGLTAEDWRCLMAVCGTGEAILDLLQDDRHFLLEHWPQVATWMGDEGPSSAWCHVPEASSLAEQRRLGGLLLGAVRAWLLSPTSPGPKPPLERQGRIGLLLDQALERLHGQVSPALVFQDFSRRLQLLDGPC